jgi:SecD/SecF fusion protein
MTSRSLTGIILLAAIIASVVYLWQPWNPDPSLRLGLDLQGGLRVLLQADEPNPNREDLNAARRVIENRVNEFGVAEPMIQTQGENRILVELPGLTAADQERALRLIGQQATLAFRIVRQGASDPLTLDDLEPAAFTGESIQNAQATFNQFNQPEVAFTIRREDASAFGQFTHKTPADAWPSCLTRRL